MSVLHNNLTFLQDQEVGLSVSHIQTLLKRLRSLEDPKHRDQTVPIGLRRQIEGFVTRARAYKDVGCALNAKISH